MKLPYLSANRASMAEVSVFGGYNHNIRIGEGEFYNTENLTSDYYPVLSPRAPRFIYKKCAADALISKSSLCCTEGSAVVIGDEKIEMGLSDEPKQLISKGAYIIIMPDKKHINTADTEDRGELDAQFVSADGATLTLCREDGSVYDKVLTVAEKPSSTGKEFQWLDTSSEPNALRQYYASTGSWGTLNTYIKIECEGIDEKFCAGDGVCISGIDAIWPEGTDKYHTVSAVGEGYIVVPGLIVPPKGIYGDYDVITVTNTASGEICISREMPVIDHMTERGNRLWGCRYGLSRNGEFVNEIYVSKASDHKNWNSYAGLSTDSYAVTVGSDGPFTAAAAYGDCTLFFKENRIHKVYGLFPAEFTTGEVICEGVELGSEKSIAQIGGILYYKGRTGIWAYDGSMPVMISEALGNVSYCDAVACAHGAKYYISMKERTTGEWHLFVYDTEKKLWHREDGTHAISFSSHGGELYYTDGEAIYTTKPCGRHEYKVKWSAESGIMSADSVGYCYVSRLDVLMRLEIDSLIRFSVEYDSSGAWEPAGMAQGSTLSVYSIPLRLRRCNHFRIRIEGEGDAKILSLTKHIARSDGR